MYNSIRLHPQHIPFHPKSKVVTTQIQYDMSQSLLQYFYQQLELGLNPKWMMTLHYQHPHEHGRPIRETANPLGHKDRYGFKTYRNIWIEAITDKYWHKRRNDLDLITKDAGQVKNVILKRLYGIKRLNRQDKQDFPHLLFVHEKGKVKLLYHTHILLPEVSAGPNTAEAILAVFEEYIRPSRKCLSRWKRVDVSPITSKEGAMSYLNKETSWPDYAFDPINSHPIIPPEESSNGRWYNTRHKRH